MPVSLIAVGDSVYQAPSDESKATDPLVMRGYVLGLAHYDEKNSKYDLQVLAFLGGKQNHVCRGVWSAEIHNQCDMLDMMVIILSFFEEVRQGPQTAVRMKEIRESGEFILQSEAFTGSGSLFSYLQADHLKFPADTGTFFHLAYIRELMRTRVFKRFYWIDTRDMCVDGMTKGKLDRLPLHQLMA
eukprot:5916800-Pyramimonas_sp.AAC.1